MSPVRISLCLLLCLLLLIVCTSQVSASNYNGLSVEWSKLLNTNESLFSPTMEPTHFNISSDGSCFVTGYFNDAHYDINNAAFVVKIDRNGNVLWNKTLPAAHRGKGMYVKATSDGGCLVAREVINTGYTADTCDIIKLDSKGNQEWSTAIRPDTGAGFRLIAIGGIALSDDGGYVVALNSLRDYRYLDYLTPEGDRAGIMVIAAFNDIIVEKLDSRGSLVWTNTITGKFDQLVSDIVKMPDDGYLLVGSTTSYASDSGNADRDFEVTYEHNFEGERVLLYRPQGANSSTSMCPMTQRDLFLVRINGNGSVAWKRTYGGDGPDFGVTALPAGNAYMVLGYGYNGRLTLAAYGSNGSDRTPLNDLYLLKVDSAGNALMEKNYGINNSLYDYSGLGIFARGNDYVLIGKNESRKASMEDSDFYEVTVDGSGALLSQKAYAADQELRDIELTPSGEYLLLTKKYNDAELSKLGPGSSAGTVGEGSGDGTIPTIAVIGIGAIVFVVCVAAGFWLMLAMRRNKK